MAYLYFLVFNKVSHFVGSSPLEIFLKCLVTGNNKHNGDYIDQRISDWCHDEKAPNLEFQSLKKNSELHQKVEHQPSHASRIEVVAIIWL